MKRRLSKKPQLKMCILAFLFFIFCFGLSSCSRYSFDINNNQVYTPKPIFTDYSLADKRLEGCIRQIIEDEQLTKPANLTRLRCSYAGVENMEGLSFFSRIEQLSLKGNPISDGSELLKLTNLSFLDISETDILDCQLISQLSSLLSEQNPNSNISNLFIHSASC